MKQILCTCSGNQVQPEVVILGADQKECGSGDENEVNNKRSYILQRKI